MPTLLNILLTAAVCIPATAFVTAWMMGGTDHGFGKEIVRLINLSPEGIEEGERLSANHIASRFVLCNRKEAQVVLLEKEVKHLRESLASPMEG